MSEFDIYNTYDPNSQDPFGTGDLSTGDAPISGLPSGITPWSSAPPLGTQNQGPSAPVSAQPGSSLLGWLGLASNVAATAVNASRGGTPTTRRPGTLTQSVTGTSITTLAVIALLFIGAVFVLRKA